MAIQSGTVDRLLGRNKQSGGSGEQGRHRLLEGGKWGVARVVGSYTVLIVGSLFMIFPLFWMVSTSLKTFAEANSPNIVWWPAEISFEGYAKNLGNDTFLRYFFNSIFVTGLALFGTVLSIAAVTYAFSRIEWPGRNIVFFLMLSTLMLPPQTTLVPQYVMFHRAGWLGTFNPIVLPGFFAGGATFIFLLRQFMLTLPKEMDEAATVDGAGHFRIWWSIIMPLTKPALATITIFLFVAYWNNLQTALIYLGGETDLLTLPVYISRMIQVSNSTQPWPEIMSASVLTTIPLIFSFLFAQRYILESIVLTGSK